MVIWLLLFNYVQFFISSEANNFSSYTISITQTLKFLGFLCASAHVFNNAYVCFCLFSSFFSF